MSTGPAERSTALYGIHMRKFTFLGGDVSSSRLSPPAHAHAGKRKSYHEYGVKGPTANKPEVCHRVRRTTRSARPPYKATVAT